MSSIIAPIRVIALSEFKSLGEFPRFPDNRNIPVDVDTVDKMVTFFCLYWLRGYPGAPGYDTRPRPDSASHDKYRFCIDAIEKDLAFTC